VVITNIYWLISHVNPSERPPRVDEGSHRAYEDKEHRLHASKNRKRATSIADM
jgi:hypothetical protein